MKVSDGIWYVVFVFKTTGTIFSLFSISICSKVEVFVPTDSSATPMTNSSVGVPPSKLVGESDRRAFSVCALWCFDYRFGIISDLVVRSTTWNASATLPKPV